MARYTETDPAALDPAQRRIWDEIAAGPRGGVPAPLQIWLKSPELAARAQHLGAFARYGTSLPPRLSELAILCTARFWTSQYEWHHHESFARKAGIGDAVIAAIAARRVPVFEKEDERAVYEFCTAFYRDKAVDDATFQRAAALLGERGVVELVGVMGYYSLISITLNAFEVPVPAGAEPPLAP
ncbi:MAG TPA: carboxymuconolactone decarboxylase family protein [Stellaceae bacterium]|nr:carboxymuconolactone decarboxylase family protein [Stellaceae bacterium]